ncbi:MAG: 3'(2'),5'-bisphosphate nucleotidase CysQ [Kiritimatiellaeota bacterium]|nr:3'(2'),5'-bisphosphate nucleotidase CysQ [Kiritimatiellota bacterium]
MTHISRPPQHDAAARRTCLNNTEANVTGKNPIMPEATLDPLLVEVIDAAMQAGIAIFEKSEAGPADSKHDGSPVTAADRAAHEAILAVLKDLTPRRPIVSEEGDLQREFSEAAQTEEFWLVDPLDGTKEYIAGRPDFTVNIALVRRNQPVLSVVHAPATGALYFARRGKGAWAARPEFPLEQTPPLPDPAAAHPGVLVGAMSRSHGDPETEALFKALGIETVVRRGSSLKLCSVAEGIADFYPRLGPTWYWDTAAAALVAREAGCRVTDLAGRPLDYSAGGTWKHQGFLVARQDELIARATAILQDMGKTATA